MVPPREADDMYIVKKRVLCYMMMHKYFLKKIDSIHSHIDASKQTKYEMKGKEEWIKTANWMELVDFQDYNNNND
ncbi:unnamed protein product [Heterobilharzia americana]|nr:unnamed protein product [Heterobilharzia americana]